MPRRRPSPLWSPRAIPPDDLPTTHHGEDIILDLRGAGDVAIRANARLRGHNSRCDIGPVPQWESDLVAFMNSL